MKTFETTIDIDAPPGRVWEVVADITRWPEWTRSVKKVASLDGGATRVGARFRLHQLDLLPAVWTIIEWDPGKGFVWISGHPGLQTRAEHGIEPIDGGSRLTLCVTYSGLLSGPVGALARSLTEHFLLLESTGCKARAEGRI